MNDSTDQLIEQLKKENLVILSKPLLLDFMIEANLATKEDARFKYLTTKQACMLFGVTRYWLETSAADPYSRIKIIAGKAKNSVNRYSKQSIMDELKRQEI